LMVWLPASCHLSAQHSTAQHVQDSTRSSSMLVSTCCGQSRAGAQGLTTTGHCRLVVLVLVLALLVLRYSGIVTGMQGSPLVAGDDVSVVQRPQHTDLCSRPVSQSRTAQHKRAHKPVRLHAPNSSMQATVHCCCCMRYRTVTPAAVAACVTQGAGPARELA
jgi:hypothetical protein